MHDPTQPFPRTAATPEIAEQLVRYAVFAADYEAARTAPPSRIRTPDGGSQRETQAEFTTRVVTAAVLHLVEIGLLEVPADFDARLDDYLPLSRDDGA